MEFIRIAKKLGNSSGVILPKKLLGAEVKITVVNMSLNIKKEVLKLIENYTEDILGIYLLSRKPIEVLVISGNIKKIIETEKMKLIFVPLAIIKKDIKENLKLRSRILQAETIFNKFLLAELRKEIKL